MYSFLPSDSLLFIYLIYLLSSPTFLLFISWIEGFLFVCSFVCLFFSFRLFVFLILGLNGCIVWLSLKLCHRYLTKLEWLVCILHLAIFAFFLLFAFAINEAHVSPPRRFWLSVGISASVLFSPYLSSKTKISCSKGRVDICLGQSAFSLCLCSQVWGPVQSHALLRVGDLKDFTYFPWAHQWKCNAVLSIWLVHGETAFPADLVTSCRL